MPKENPIEIRDVRRKQMFQVDDEYLNGYARFCGISATGVYISLCRHANKDQECWPSMDLIAEELAVSKRTVIRSIKMLMKWGIIQVEKSKNDDTKRQNPNRYTLTDKSCWKPKPSDNKTLGSGGGPSDNNDTSRVTKTTQSRVTPGHCKETQYEGNTVEGIATSDDVADKIETKTINPKVEKINVVLEKFQMLINPTINYGNKTQRKATESLIERFGLEKVIRLVEYAASVQNEEFSPTITTPYQLQEKLAQLIGYYNKREMKTKSKTMAIIE